MYDLKDKKRSLNPVAILIWANQVIGVILRPHIKYGRPKVVKLGPGKSLPEIEIYPPKKSFIGHMIKHL